MTERPLNMREAAEASDGRIAEVVRVVRGLLGDRDATKVTVEVTRGGTYRIAAEAELRALVSEAYHEGFEDGHDAGARDEDTGSGETWLASRARLALAALVRARSLAPDAGAAALDEMARLGQEIDAMPSKESER